MICVALTALLFVSWGAGSKHPALTQFTYKFQSLYGLIVVAMLASTVGGYVAGRLRTKWAGVHGDEVAFRDTAHGFLAWAFAAVLGSAVFGGAATYLVGGTAQGAAQGAAYGSAAGVQEWLRRSAYQQNSRSRTGSGYIQRFAKLIRGATPWAEQIHEDRRRGGLSIEAG